MPDNPYRFTVSVKWSVFALSWRVVLCAPDDPWFIDWSFATEAEANTHADLILAALKEATRE